MGKSSKTIGVVVLGDVGRSPRMQFHSYSLVQEGYSVKILGYRESDFSEDRYHNVQLLHLPSTPDFKKYLPQFLSFILKVIWQSITLLFSLIWNGRFHILVVQNPPAIPTLPVCWFYCLLFRSTFVIDWHNYAYTILSLSVGPNHFLVKLSKYLEFLFGKLAHYNICVTNAMKDDLSINHNIRAVTLHDHPGPLFTESVGIEKREEFFTRLSSIDENFIRLVNSKDNPGLLISSTSWTEDEDFSILLDALIDYDEMEHIKTPLICVITGKGPLKEYYIRLISKLMMKKLKIITPWLEYEDYPKLLGFSDLGVCLHKSSSGLDLPMKVVDMFGAGLPVCAYGYPCLSELVRDNENGLIFQNSEELAKHLELWFKNYPTPPSLQKHFKAEIEKFSNINWHSNWLSNVSHIFDK